jgi:hypothetical protein
MIMKTNTEVNTKNPKTGGKNPEKPKNSKKNQGKEKKKQGMKKKKKLNLTPQKQVWPRLLINARTLKAGYELMLEHWPQGLQIGFPNSMMVSLYYLKFFSACIG